LLIPLHGTGFSNRSGNKIVVDTGAAAVHTPIREGE
jgi:hypothetical protein